MIKERFLGIVDNLEEDMVLFREVFLHPETMILSYFSTYTGFLLGHL